MCTWPIAPGVLTQVIKIGRSVLFREFSLGIARKPRSALNGTDILVLALSYKPNVADDRESPSYEVIKLLKEKKARGRYSIPTFPDTPPSTRSKRGSRNAAASFSSRPPASL